MSIKSELSVLKVNIQNAKNKLYTNLVDKGVTDITTASTLDVMADSVSDIVTGGGGSEGGDLFEAIGYNKTPKFIQEGITTAKNIYDNWDNSLTTLDEKIFSGTNITFFPSVDTSNVTKLWMTFNNQRNMLYFPHIDTSNMEEMYAVFAGCKNLLDVDLSNWDTRKVTKMREMFYGCNSLTSLDLSNWNTEKVTIMYGMFSGCTSLTLLDVSSFDTSNVTNMTDMFRDCSGLTSLDLSNFNTSGVTNMNSMFNGCKSLTSLNVSSFDTSNVTNMSYMFGNCSGLTSLDLSSFDTSKVTTITSMFFQCKSLTEIHWNNFGNGSGYTEVSISNSSKLGINTTEYPNARQVLTSTFVTNSFDRATAGYSSCKITFNSNTKALFTSDEIAAITAKGYTIA